MTEADDYEIRGIDLSADRYTVVQSLVRNKYRAEDPDGNVVLRGKQKLFELKERFPFVDDDGEEVMTVTTDDIIDIAGNYVLSDAQTGEELVVLDNDFSIFQDTWRVRDGHRRDSGELTRGGCQAPYPSPSIGPLKTP